MRVFFSGYDTIAAAFSLKKNLMYVFVEHNRQTPIEHVGYTLFTLG